MHTGWARVPHTPGVPSWVADAIWVEWVVPKNHAKNTQNKKFFKKNLPRYLFYINR